MKYFNINLLVLLLISLIVSCKKRFLDEQPLDKIGINSYWKTPADFDKYIIQFYPRFPTFPDNFTGLSESNSDNAIGLNIDPVLSGRRPSVTGNWINEWTPIRGVNIFFDNFKLLAPANVELFSQFLGEAYFFRAWFYFNLVRKYGDVPWYSSVIKPQSVEDLQKPRDSRTLVIDKILSDLDSAALHLELRSEIGNTRLNREAALAFTSRVALFEGTWQKYHAGTVFATPNAQPEKYFKKCIDAADELIQGGAYTKGLYKNYYELFGLDDMASIDEVLFWKAGNIKENMGNNAQLYVTNWTAGGGVTWDLVTSYLDKNGNPYDYGELSKTKKGNDFLNQIANDIDLRLSSTIWIPGDLRVSENNVRFQMPFINADASTIMPTGFGRKKFSNPYSPGAGKNFGSYSETGRILFRYAEVLLNYAEALWELNQVVAYSELNFLRQRVEMPAFKIIDQQSDPHRIDYGYQIPDELYEIRRERRVELALEDFREDDYRRWAAHKLFLNKRPLGYPFKSSEFPGYTPNLDPNGLIDYHKNELPDGYLFKPGRDYLSPLPQDELTLNPNLSQNPGW